MERTDRSWVPITERMPDKEWMEYGERTYYPVSHWMMLPDLPGEVSNESH